MPRFDWSFNFGHIVTVASVLFAMLLWVIRLREEQAAIRKWIDDHDRDLKMNMALFQDLRTQAALTTQLLSSLVTRVERLEDK